ncbi:MAG: hypothetical protein KatS3mg094_454 [Candidatus Parcubacteria bacterium]|nr:MAG: hypothetical protein KatS3mg094_454 [Candidatus Parcubacteria bacterium]
MYLIGDVGGTKTRLTIIDKIYINSNQSYRYLKQKTKFFNTPQKYEDFLGLIFKFLKKLRKRIDKVCFGFAGNFDLDKEKLIYSPNLKDYIDRDLKKDLERILHSCQSVVLENDAALAGLGEAYYGAGKNFNVFGYITLGTGVGGVKIIKRELMQTGREQMQTKFFIDDNVFGFEPGHSFILICGINGSGHRMNGINGKDASANSVKSVLSPLYQIEVEEIIGGKSLEKIFKKKPEKIKNKKLLDDMSKILAIFLINVSIFWSVDKIILGGGLTKSLNFKKLNFYVNEFHPLPIKIKIIKSKLGEFAGLFGGLNYIKNF